MSTDVIEQQVGCGYCKYELVCAVRTPDVNRAKLGCKAYVHHEDPGEKYKEFAELVQHKRPRNASLFKWPEFNDDEYFQLKDIKEEADKMDVTNLNLIEGIRDVGGDGFYCGHFGEVCDRREEGCGISCRGYQPRNGKSGICKHWSFTYTEGRDIILRKINGKWTTR